MISVWGWAVMGAHLIWSFWRLVSFEVPGKVLLLVWFCAFWTVSLQQDLWTVAVINLIYSVAVMFAPDGFFAAREPGEAAEEEDHVFSFPGKVVGAIFMAALGLIPYGVFQFLR